jgi:hypothetical protein
MYRTVVGTISLLLFAPALWGGDLPKSANPDKAKDAAKEEKSSATPAEQYQALAKKFQKAQQDFFKEYQQAKTAEARKKLFQEKYPQPAKYSAKMMALVDKNPKSPTALDALVWIVTHDRFGLESRKALDLLIKDHIDSPKISAVVSPYIYPDPNQTEKLLRTILQKSPHKEVQAEACLSLGQILKNRADNPRISPTEREKLDKEAEAQFERVLKEFHGVKVAGRPIDKSAERELFELRHLAVGKKAPQISGEDLEGKPFKLSDYLGKVVVLDFWGNW